MGMDEGHTVTINGTTTTTVGSIEGVLGGVRHVGKRRVWDESDRDVADVSARRACTLISLRIKSIVLPIRNSPLTRNSVHNSTHPTRSPT
jgi:hypothetical protein